MSAVKPKVTQQQIAELAGVSHVAVSYALHRPHLGRINAEKQREIQEIADRLGYQPRRMTTRVVGLCVSLRNLGLNVVTNTILFANAALAQRQYSLLLLAGDEAHPERFAQIEKTVDGVLVFDQQLAAQMVPVSMPSVLIADADPQTLAPNVDWIALDIEAAARAATRHLLERQHERLALLTGNEQSAFWEHQKSGFFGAIREAGLPPDAGQVVPVGGSAWVAGALEKLFAAPAAPTALLAGSAGYAAVSLTVLQNAGRRVPDDVSLLALEDGHHLAAMRPAISAHTQIEAAVVEAAVERLLTRISKPARCKEPVRRLLPGALIERDSVAMAR